MSSNFFLHPAPPPSPSLLLSLSLSPSPFLPLLPLCLDNSLALWNQSILYLAFFGLWVLSAIISTSYTFSWDVLMDWSLFPNIPQRCCRKNALTLRQDRIYSYKVSSVMIYSLPLGITHVMTPPPPSDLLCTCYCGGLFISYFMDIQPLCGPPCL